MKNLIFFCIASAILLFSIITINIAPIIGGLIANNWMEDSCKYYSDKYDFDNEKDYSSQDLKDKDLEEDKRNLERCNRQQAMVGLEYTSLNANICIGFICAFLGLLLYLNLGNLGKIPGLIGLGGGFVGFVLTFVYVIESGLIFNDNINYSIKRIDSDGALLEWDGGKYICIFYEKDNRDSFYLKYSELGNKYLSYSKDITFHKDDDKKYLKLNNGGCNCYENINEADYIIEGASTKLSASFSQCAKINGGEINSLKSKINDCDKLFYFEPTTNNNLKILYDRWLTSIIFSCFIFLFDIGLAIFGFLIFRESGGSSGSVAIK